MPRGSKAKYSEKQKRQARDIEKGYEQRGVSEGESERRAWATVNKMYGGGAKGGSGSRRIVDKSPARKGGRASASRPKAARSASAKKAAQSRKRNAAKR